MNCLFSLFDTKAQFDGGKSIADPLGPWLHIRIIKGAFKDSVAHIHTPGQIIRMGMSGGESHVSVLWRFLEDSNVHQSWDPLLWFLFFFIVKEKIEFYLSLAIINPGDDNFLKSKYIDLKITNFKWPYFFFKHCDRMVMF